MILSEILLIFFIFLLLQPVITNYVALNTCDFLYGKGIDIESIVIPIWKQSQK
ncbi:hypothetical protein OTSUT76_0578 [Orientia tsutsugamushi str. UT76]|uniref:Uncharacterized protein n=1 Tax=Orientia tsutsugamushi TaxID=784 RepID=A0A2U3QU30_ORITS|nr:hypothetical protein OTSUT76_0578 [Orientia tsutsugamushi str. UT76]SPR04463.1 Uncharacterised protein [Orientia tsutsugamushi]